MSIYIEDEAIQPFCATVECLGISNPISICNTGQMEFPLTDSVEADYLDSSTGSPCEVLSATSTARKDQGGAVYTVYFPPSVQSVQVILYGRPMTDRVELLQGPNNNKQVMEVYTEEDCERPFYAVIDTPGVENVVRIVSTATISHYLTHGNSWSVGIINECSLVPYQASLDVQKE